MKIKANFPMILAFYKSVFLSLVFTGLIGLAGCQSGTDHPQSLQSAKEREMTVGIVQKEIRVGMPQADVAAALGSPNIVTRDSEGKETWIYDKAATEASYSRSSGGAYATLVIVGAGGNRALEASSVTQKTLTVVIKFDSQGQVSSFTYHSTKF